MQDGISETLFPEIYEHEHKKTLIDGQPVVGMRSKVGTAIAPTLCHGKGRPQSIANYLAYAQAEEIWGKISQHVLSANHNALGGLNFFGAYCFFVWLGHVQPNAQYLKMALGHAAGRESHVLLYNDFDTELCGEAAL